MIELRCCGGQLCAPGGPGLSGPQALSREDLVFIWGLLRAEHLLEVLFHDGGLRSWADFSAFARSEDLWFFAALHAGALLGIGYVNGFSSSGNMAFAHCCSFRYGRNGLFALAAKRWLTLLRDAGRLRTLIGVLPAPYRSARNFAERCGFRLVDRFPKALFLHRRGRKKTADACLYRLDLARLEELFQAV